MHGRINAAGAWMRRSGRTPPRTRVGTCRVRPIPRGARAKSPLACGGDAGRKGQGEEGSCSDREVRDRAACGDDVGPAAQACLRGRCGELRALRKSRTCHCEHRGAGADRANRGACAGDGRNQRGLNRPAVDGAAGECMSGARDGARSACREAAIGDRQRVVLRAGGVRRETRDERGCEGRCAPRA